MSSAHKPCDPNPRARNPMTIGDIAATVSGAARVLSKSGINYCAMADMSVEEAAQTHGIDHEALQRELTRLEKTPSSMPEDSGELVNFIISHYHETHRKELRELVGLAWHVETVHHEHQAAPNGLASFLEKIQGDLEDHMHKEESILFPSICSGYRGSLFGPIFVMRHEHDDHAKSVRELQILTAAFTTPEDACGTWQTLYDGLEKLTSDLLEHIYVENNVLFPRFEATR